MVCNLGLLCLKEGLLWGIMAYDFRQLGFAGISGSSAQDVKCLKYVREGGPGCTIRKRAGIVFCVGIVFVLGLFCCSLKVVT